MTAATLRPGVLVLLAVVLVSSGATGGERSTARRFEAARGDEPSLTAFLLAMPKGADLHHHFPAGIFAEEALRSALRRGLFFDPATSRFEAQMATGRVPADRLLTDDALRYQFLNAASMRGPFTGPAGGHDHFFQTFGVLGTAIPSPDLAQLLVEIVRRARLQRVQYLELMASPGAPALERLQAAALPAATPEELLRQLKPLLDDHVTEARADLDRWERQVVDTLGFSPREATLDRPVTVRYLISAFRTAPDAQVMASWAAGFALMKADPRVVGVNLAGPEDHPLAQEGFERQMRILDGLWRRSERPNVSLHAGELTLWVSPLEAMTSRIRRSIEQGHARRIGHGISMAWEDDLAGLLKTMRAEGIAVEVCPSSNALILGAEGDRHPFQLYRRAGVPLTINTDDGGINRSNLTMEYVRAVRAWGLSYQDVKALVRNGVEYAFVAGQSLFEDRDYRQVRPPYRKLQARGWVPTPAEARALAASDKATIQARLERALYEFEK